MFLGTLQAVAEVIDHSPAEETSRGLESALRYFTQAAPKHTADEEESLFPRLRRIHDPEIESAVSKLEQLEQDHRWAAPLHANVERLGTRYLSTGSLSSSAVEQFRKDVANLASMYQQHIRVEESVVFPLAARMLSHADKIAMAEEMAGRRNVKLVTERS
jgi:hemerythrin-like domain-containing protein